MAPVPTLEGWTLTWADAVVPATPVLYAQLPAIPSDDGQHLRLFPALSHAPTLDDALVSAGGPGEDPPAHGVLVQLVDPTGRVVHEVAVLPPGRATSGRVVTVADLEGTRALLLPAVGGGFGAGWWTLAITARSDAGPDLSTWTRAGKAADRTAHLCFRIAESLPYGGCGRRPPG